MISRSLAFCYGVHSWVVERGPRGTMASPYHQMLAKTCSKNRNTLIEQSLTLIEVIYSNRTVKSFISHCYDSKCMQWCFC